MTGQEAVKIIDRLGVSRRQFAFMCEIHPNTLSRWAAGGEVSGMAAALLRLLYERPELIHVMQAWRQHGVRVLPPAR